ncbi:MAG: sensor histidine kinase [Chloroflexi bacterium]|nr:sensor histidine kinase [Chloroflexota bacterium]
MIPIKRPTFLTFSTVIVLSILALLAGAVFLIPLSDDAVRPVAFALLALLVMVLVFRETTEHTRAEDAAHKAQTLNAELDQRVAQRTRELENANRELETEIADHENTTEQLRLLTAHLQSAREEERVRIAQEIHDEIGTLMTAIKMDLAFLSKEIAGKSGPRSPETLQQEIGDTTKLVDNAIQTIHQIVLELRPAVLDHLGLRAALEWQMREFQKRTKIECQFDSNVDALRLDAERSTALFRILQETLTNVARHAHATHVDASLREQDHHLILNVHDNGTGISTDQVTSTHRLGLLGMRERAHIFGGDVVVQGGPKAGTTVTVRIPLRGKEDGGD